MYEVGSTLSVRKDFYRHVGIYAGDGMVFHNHPSSGQQLVSIEQFAAGRRIKVKRAGIKDSVGFYQRLRQAQTQPRSYNLLRRNCEHTASTLRGERAASPQLRLYSGLSVIAAAAIIAIGRAARR